MLSVIRVFSIILLVFISQLVALGSIPHRSPIEAQLTFVADVAHGHNRSADILVRQTGPGEKEGGQECPRSYVNAFTEWLPASVSFTYDDNGNMVSDGLRWFEYDDANQLKAVTVSNSFRSEFGGESGASSTGWLVGHS